MYLMLSKSAGTSEVTKTMVIKTWLTFFQYTLGYFWNNSLYYPWIYNLLSSLFIYYPMISFSSSFAFVSDLHFHICPHLRYFFVPTCHLIFWSLFHHCENYCSSQWSACFCFSWRNACFSISFLNSPCLLASSSVCWPTSATCCWSSTATALAFWMVDRRWAITTTVLPWGSERW